MHLKQLQEKGDTIVEVLIAITIISFILVGGYVVTNQSLEDEQQSQERAEALQVDQAQLEATRAAIVTGTITHSTNIYEPTTFCMVNGVAEVPSSINDDCTFSDADVPSTVQPAFTIQISYPEAATPPYVYNINAQATWAQLGGGKKGNVTLLYRDYGAN